MGAGTAARAVAQSYSDKDAFLVAAPTPVSILDFEAMTTGYDLSGAFVSMGSFTINFPDTVDDVAGDPGETLSLMVVDDIGDNPTSSPNQSLGTNDIGNYDLLIAGTEVPLSFSTTVSGIGLSIITPEPPGTFLLNSEVQLVVPGEATATLNLADGQLLGNFDGDDYYAYFLGVIAFDAITTATLSYNPATPDGSFLFNIDDILVVPEANASLLLMAGLAGLLALDNRRSSQIQRTSSATCTR
jgi:hypothetical protein